MFTQFLPSISARRLVVSVALFAVMVAVSILATAGTVAHAAPSAPPASRANPLLQFTSGGHVIGFAPTQIYLAGLDHALRIEFVGAAEVTPVTVSAETNASHPTQRSGQAQPLGVVTYPELWRGIDVEYRAAAGSIVKSTYTVAPGADPTQIRLRYNVPVQLQSDGSLQYAFGHGYLSESAPIAWQEIGGARVPVQVTFRVFETFDARPQSAIRNPESTIGFRLGVYDPRYALTIDPNYQWHTFYGSSTADEGYGIAVDGDNNLYVAGISDDTWQGDGNANPLHAHSGANDIVVVKLSSAGAYQWHTFYGSSADDYGYDVTVAGNYVYVTGYSLDTWNGDGNTPPLHAYSGAEEIVVVKLNNAGVYQWHTFYGSNDADYGDGIAVNGSNVYVAGSSTTTWQGDGNASPLHVHSGPSEIVVVKLNDAGAYQWHTFYGSSDDDAGWAIAVDGDSNVYVAGISYTTWNVGGTNPLHAHSGINDIIVVKLESNGDYLWHTFYGSSVSDAGRVIAVDGSNNVYVAGYSDTTWNVDSTNPLHAHSGDADIVALKLTSAGAYQWHTFYGSSSGDDGNGIAVDGSNVYVAGHSYDTWQGNDDRNPLHPYSGANEIAVVKLNSAGAYQWHTFYGSGASDTGGDIALDTSSNVYVTGHSDAGGGEIADRVIVDGSVLGTEESYESWQGDNGNNPIHAHSGSSEIAMVKLSPSPSAVNETALQARIRGDSIILKWQTTLELNIVGFDIYRQTGKRAWKKINADLIPAQHVGNAMGARYRYEDARVKADKTYRYKIRVLFLNGQSEWTESVRVRMK